MRYASLVSGEDGKYSMPPCFRWKLQVQYVSCFSGEEGKPVHTSMEEKTKADQTVREFGFNMVASDKIAMNRSVPDTRMEEWVHLF